MHGHCTVDESGCLITPLPSVESKPLTHSLASGVTTNSHLASLLLRCLVSRNCNYSLSVYSAALLLLYWNPYCTPVWFLGIPAVLCTLVAVLCGVTWHVSLAATTTLGQSVSHYLALVLLAVLFGGVRDIEFCAKLFCCVICIIIFMCMCILYMCTCIGRLSVFLCVYIVCMCTVFKCVSVCMYVHACMCVHTPFTSCQCVYMCSSIPPHAEYHTVYRLL